jgi:alpha-L-rhamnosidase
MKLNLLMKRLFGYLFLTMLSASCLAQTLSVINLRCEYKQDPIGVDAANPVFSWELVSSQKNVLQTAYRVLVAEKQELLQKNIGNTWDTKRLSSGSSIQVVYKGKTLQAGKKYYWKVMVWDNKGNVSSWSNEAYWQMGLLTPADWNGAKWIGYEEIIDTMIIVPHIHGNGKRSWGARRNVLPMLRKAFAIAKPVKKATAFICGLGHFEMSINGSKIADHFLDPGWTNYSKQALYVTFDITDKLKQGKNAIGVMLGNGFYYIPGQRYRKMTGAYGMPKMILRTLVEYADGTSESIISNESWKTEVSPIIFSSIFGGEDYDANLEQTGWDMPSFDDTKWRNVIITNGPVILNSQMAEPVKIMERFAVKTKSSPKPGIVVYDLGQNFSGIPSITVKGSKGDTIRIIPAELMNEDGTANQRATGSPSYFTYILKGDNEESWQPKFSYTGFRYLEVRCIAHDSLQANPVIKSIEGLHIRSAAATAGSFVSSNPLFNNTHQLIDWAIKSNTVSLFTDCPHREKLGWLEQTYLMGSSVHYRYDIPLLNRKMITDMVYSQHEDGKMPEIAPEFTAFTPPFDESPEWGSACIILPWYNYQWYGDKQLLAESYEMMKRYTNYLSTKAKNNILSHGLGDWYDIGPNRPGLSQMTRAGVTATATYYYDLTILSQIARLLNKQSDATMFAQQAVGIRRSFNDQFFDKVKLQYDSASQAANAMALFMGLVEPKYKDAVLNALIKDIRGRNTALTAGDIGYRYVLRALEDAGRSDVIFEMNNRDDVPGYGYQLKNGATALTESWQGLTVVSNNHFMLGHIMEWFYAGLAGIKQARDGVGYNKIEIRPQPVGDITLVAASYLSPYGEISSKWSKNGDLFILDISIPANTTATIYLPGSTKPVNTGSGNYTYTTKLK